jgi:hypothetical protein
MPPPGEAADTAPAVGLLASPGLEREGAAVLGVLVEVRTQLLALPLGPQAVANSVLYRIAPSDDVTWNFLVLFHVERLKQRNKQYM